MFVLYLLSQPEKSCSELGVAALIPVLLRLALNMVFFADWDNAFLRVDFN